MLNLEFIEDRENLFRAVPPNPVVWKAEFNRPSSALFKDSKGCSVDRDGDRTEKETILALEYRFKNCGVVSINAKRCRELDTYPVPKPSKRNKYHSEIHDSENKILISNSKSRKLSLNCRVIKIPPIS